MAVSVACVLLALPAAASAAPPANDDFANAIVLPSLLPVLTVTGTNVEATIEADEPAPLDLPIDASMWWQWTAPATGTVTISLCASNFDTVLGVYTGTTVVALTPLSSSDDSCGGGGFFAPQSRLSFLATSGVNYKLQVSGFDGDTGNVTLDITAPAAPVNDDFANAIAITGSPSLGSNVNASREAGEPLHGGPGDTSVWWRWTPPASGEALVSACDSAFIALAGVYTGSSVGALTDVVTDRIECFSYFEAQAGTEYRIAVAGYDEASGDVRLNVNVAPPPPPPVVEPPPPPAPALVLQPPTVVAPPPPPAARPQPGCAGAGNVIVGTIGADTRSGTAARDIMFGLAGSDALTGAGGDDCLYGEAGGDRLTGGAGADRLFGGAGADRLSGGSGNDRLTGAGGNDRLTGGSGTDRFSAGAGADRISARDRRRETITCGSGRDVVVADRVDRVARDCERVSRR